SEGMAPRYANPSCSPAFGHLSVILIGTLRMSWGCVHLPLERRAGVALWSNRPLPCGAIQCGLGASQFHSKEPVMTNPGANLFSACAILVQQGIEYWTDAA